MKDQSASDEKVVILAPTGQDSLLAAQALEQAGVSSELVTTLPDLSKLITSNDRGAILIAEEALLPRAIPEFVEALSQQDTWSDIPVVSMTGSGKASHSSLQILNYFASCENVTLLERPCRTVTITSAIQFALRARRKQYEVRRLIKELAASVRQRDDFMSIASHELKTPLTSLKLQTQLNERALERGDQRILTAEGIRKLVQNTHKQVDRLSRLVEDMLDISRINTGKLSIASEAMNLTELTAELIERFQPQLAEAGCTVVTDLELEVAGNWDRYRVEQVINNLLSNAVKYSTGGQLQIVVKKDSDWAELSVQDQGPGIATEDHERIFLRFERAVKNTGISGLGLGLFISKQIVESHGGSISLVSEPGEGSKFTVKLPLDRAA